MKHEARMLLPSRYRIVGPAHPKAFRDTYFDLKISDDVVAPSIPPCGIPRSVLDLRLAGRHRLSLRETRHVLRCAPWTLFGRWQVEMETQDKS